MISVKTIPIVIVKAFVIMSCTAVKNTNISDGEALAMKVNETQDIIAMNDLEPQTDEVSRGLIPASILAKGISLAADGLKRLIDIDKQKYTAEYKTALTDLYFYDNLSTVGAMDPTGLKFDGFDVIRTVINDQGARDTAVFLSLGIVNDDPYEIINNGIFRLRVKNFELKYAKAKVPDSRWYAPWTWFYKNDNTLNMDFEFILRAQWMTEGGILYDNVELGKFYLNLRGIPLDRDEQEAYIRDLVGTQLGGHSFLVPRSYGSFYHASKDFFPAWGQGLFNVQVNVKEAGKEKFITRVVQDNYSLAIDELVKQIK